MAIPEKSKEFQLIKAAALEQKWRVEPTARGHWTFKAPDGETSVTAGGNYKDARALKNFVARLRRGGFVPPAKMR